MIYKNAKEYLKNYKYLGLEIIKLKDSIRELESALTSISGLSFDDVKVQTFCNKDKLSNSIIELVEKRENLEKMMLRKIKLKEEIQKNLNRLQNADEKKVLEFRYLYNMTVSEVANTLYCSERWVMELSRRGLNNLEKIIGGSYVGN